MARKEQDRRKAIQKPSKVITNKDLAAVPPSMGSMPATPGAGATPEPGGTSPVAGSGGPAPSTGIDTTADRAKEQAEWSGRFKALQTQLERDETFATALQSQINALTTQYVNQADPVQQAKVATDRQKALDELNRLTKAIADDKKAIADFQEEARRGGVPPGWLR